MTEDVRDGTMVNALQLVLEVDKPMTAMAAAGKCRGFMMNI